MYGSDPDGYAYLVKGERLPSKRARYCETEYADFASSFEVLWAEVVELQDFLAGLPDRDSRSPEEILGYDAHGLPG